MLRVVLQFVSWGHLRPSGNDSTGRLACSASTAGRRSRHSLFLGLLWIGLSGCPQAEPTESDADKPQPTATALKQSLEPHRTHSEKVDFSPFSFEDVTAESGIDFVHTSGDSPEKPFPAANGSGFGAIDLDLDGRLDLHFLTGTAFPVSAAQEGTRDRTYRQLSQWTFAEVTDQTGLGHGGYSAGLAIGDVDNDGFDDIYVNCFGRNQLFMNHGDGTFSEVGHSAGVDDAGWGTSTAFLDYDSDGDLDIYVCNYAEWSYETNQFCGNRQKNVRIFCSPRSVKPVPDRLYQNLGDGRFVESLAAAGIDRQPGRGQGVVAADLNGDALVDLYVGNDANANFFFRNRGDGTFADESERSGTAHDYAGREQAGMGVDVADLNRDGQVEIFVTNYEEEHNTLYQARDPMFFQDVSQTYGMTAASLRWVGWGTQFADLNNDGWDDLAVTNGHTDDNLHELGRDAQFAQPALLFQNVQGQLRLVAGGGPYFERPHPGRSLLAIDLNRDLRIDLLIGHQDRPPALLANQTPDTAALSLSLVFSGVESNRSGIGTVVDCSTQSGRIHNQVTSGGSYLSGAPGRVCLNFDEKIAHVLTVRWPSGHQQEVAIPVQSGEFLLIEGMSKFLQRSFSNDKPGLSP